ncbi:MAG: hypothetical protein Q9M16_03165 [Mariprofundus sp.]|nr:hypothetical protein [Mariprofundus sp.]
MKKMILPLLSAALISSCLQATDVTPVSQNTIMQLSGSWLIDDGNGSIRFYSDETVKIDMPKHRPPIKLLSPYEAVKDNTLGIALGGFWSGPVLIDTSDITRNTITATFPEEEPIQLHKKP